MRHIYVECGLCEFFDTGICEGAEPTTDDPLEEVCESWTAIDSLREKVANQIEKSNIMNYFKIR